MQSLIQDRFEVMHDCDRMHNIKTVLTAAKFITTVVTATLQFKAVKHCRAASLASSPANLRDGFNHDESWLLYRSSKKGYCYALMMLKMAIFYFRKDDSLL